MHIIQILDNTDNVKWYNNFENLAVSYEVKYNVPDDLEFYLGFYAKKKKINIHKKNCTL